MIRKQWKDIQYANEICATAYQAIMMQVNYSSYHVYISGELAYVLGNGHDRGPPGGRSRVITDPIKPCPIPWRCPESVSPISGTAQLRISERCLRASL